MASHWRNDFPTTTNPLRFLWFTSRPHWKPMALAICAVAIAAVLSASISYVFKLIADAAVGLPSEESYRALLYACAAYIFVTLTTHLVWRLSGFAGGVWANNARATGRHALAAYVTLHSRQYFSSRFAGSISNKIGHASNGMRDMIDLMLWQFFEFSISILASLVIAYTVSPVIAYVFILWVLATAIANLYMARKRIPYSSATQKMETTLNGATVDLLSNITTMQEYARRRFEIERLKGLIERRRVAGIRNWHYGETMLTLNGLVQALFSAAIVFLAVYLTRFEAISIGDIILIVTMIFRLEGQMLFLGSHLNSFGERWGEVEESLREILEPHEIPDKEGAKDLKLMEGEIELDAVTFAYAGNRVFENLSLTIPAGQRVGLVGKSGAGKSTLIRLLLHHHDLTGGVIRLDGTDIASVTQESLRASISVVPQEPLLFHRSIRENIAYGNPNASEERIIEAARLAHAHEFIVRLPQGYDALVGERGVKLSGGERQRVAIARAIIKDAPILLLDEATSALDSESEVAIQEALRELMKEKTVIAIAHRLSTLREMDRIIVLDKGKIVEEGTHDELVQKGGIYSELWSHQAGGFLKE